MIPSTIAANIEDYLPSLIAMDQADCPVVHSFGPGIYIREVSLPAGILAVGHYHNTPHMNVMLKGRMTLLGDDGIAKEISAPFMMTSGPGRKVAVIHEDVVWLNIYSTEETDVSVLEEKLFNKAQCFIDFQETKLKAERLRISCDNSDFTKMLEQFGLSKEFVHDVSRNEADMVPLPNGSYKILVADSPIQGRGLFATAPIAPGDVIAPARIAGGRTIAGRFTNHSATPNAQMTLADNGDVDLVAIRSISGCKGGMCGEEITIDYRQALTLGSKQ